MSGKVTKVSAVEMQIEINSLDLYLRILKSVDPASISVFKKIVSEEKRHIKMLGDLLSRYAGGKNG